MVVGDELPENVQATRKQLIAYSTCTLTFKMVVKSLLFALALFYTGYDTKEKEGKSSK